MWRFCFHSTVKWKQIVKPQKLPQSWIISPLASTSRLLLLSILQLLYRNHYYPKADFLPLPLNEMFVQQRQKFPRKMPEIVWAQVWFYPLSIQRDAMAAGKCWQSLQALASIMTAQGKCSGKEKTELFFAHSVFNLSSICSLKIFFSLLLQWLLSSHYCLINLHSN